MTDYTVALLFGAAVIFTFAWDQFKRPSYPQSRELTRIIEFLSPSDLRNRRVYYRAYAAYVTILLSIYLVVSVFATVPVLDAFGLFASEGDNVGNAGARSPIVPLTISLMMVGLAPNVPILNMVEEKIRYAAHHVSGIPSRLLHGCRVLLRRRVVLPDGRLDLLVPERDHRRLERYRATGNATLPDPEKFERSLDKIVVWRFWIRAHGLNATAIDPSIVLQHSAGQIDVRIDRLFLGLDSLSGFERGATTATDPGTTPTDGAPSRALDTWEALAKEASEIAADVCALLMLYVEHGLIDARADTAAASNPAFEPASGPDAAEDAAAASAALSTFLRGSEGWAEESATVGVVWTHATLATVVAAFVWGLFLGKLESGRSEMALVIAGSYVLSAVLTYSPALFVALSIHERRLQSESWHSIVATHWARWIGPVAGVFVAAGAVALACSVARNLYRDIAKQGFEKVWPEFWAVVQGALQGQGAQMMLGAILAVGMVGLVDAWREGPDGQRLFLRVSLMTAGAMALWAPLAYWLSQQYYFAAAGRELPSLYYVMSEDSRFWFAALRAGLIGLSAMILCQMKLARGLSDEDRQRRTDAVVSQPAS